MNYQNSKPKVIVGRCEPVDLLDFGLSGLPAKVDTGAYRSAIQADRVKLSKDGKTLSYRLLGGHGTYKHLAQTFATERFSRVSVINSFGHREDRYEVSLRVCIGGKKFTSTFTLASRQKLTYPILIGRKLLNRRFMVDPAIAHVDRRALKQQYGIEIPKDEETEHGDSL